MKAYEYFFLIVIVVLGVGLFSTVGTFNSLIQLGGLSAASVWGDLLTVLVAFITIMFVITWRR